MVERFGSSIKRLEILQGFLNYRKNLHMLGLVQGVQWLDGSFVESIEVLEGRAPNDIDVVTFANMPEGESQKSLLDSNSSLFIPTAIRQTYKVDGYCIFLDGQANQNFIKQVTYWYSMWSHTRSKQWKGFLQLDLNNTNDDQAFESLSSLWESVDEQ
ncbi:DUF6932 family protein [Oligella ureolytica]|uniref:Uncharacterized protein n=1 Tax=Oligella ureolytica TaxID=90244 RepID=A0A7T3EUS0_9BURK|nr:hypothetical protein [Oligella ureolytica]QPT40347.1 hypothetical protein I6G29_01600 [Oligella ureolytica]